MYTQWIDYSKDNFLPNACNYYNFKGWGEIWENTDSPLKFIYAWGFANNTGTSPIEPVLIAEKRYERQWTHTEYQNMEQQKETNEDSWRKHSWVSTYSNQCLWLYCVHHNSFFLRYPIHHFKTNLVHKVPNWKKTITPLTSD